MPKFREILSGYFYDKQIDFYGKKNENPKIVAGNSLRSPKRRPCSLRSPMRPLEPMEGPILPTLASSVAPQKGNSEVIRARPQISHPRPLYSPQLMAAGPFFEIQKSNFPGEARKPLGTYRNQQNFVNMFFNL